MKKTMKPQWFLLPITLLLTLAAAIVRRQQLLREILTDGSLADGSKLHYVLAALCLLWLVAAAACLLPLEKRPQWQQSFSAAIVPNALQLVAAVCLCSGNVVLWVHGYQPVTALASQTPVILNLLYRLLPPLGILSAVCIAAFAVCSLLDRKPSPLLYMAASVYLVIRLIICFQQWNIDPSIHDYCFQLLAAICCMLAAFQIAGFCFDRGKRRMTLFWSLGTVLFCGISMADMLLRGSTDALLINGSLLLSMLVSSVQLLFGAQTH